MSQQPCCKWSVQQLVLYNKTLSDRSISSGALSSHAHNHAYSTWQQQTAVRFLRGCIGRYHILGKTAAVGESFNRCFAKTKTMRLEESTVLGLVRLLWAGQQLGHSSERISTPKMNSLVFKMWQTNDWFLFLKICTFNGFQQRWR